MKSKFKSPPNYSYHKIQCMLKSLNNLTYKRKSYGFQLLKQFILFPCDQSQSSQKTISRYDRLLFDDQALHTMFKKIQTKVLENKIWGFINIRALPYIQAAKNIQHQIKRIARKTQQQNKIITFYKIKSYAYAKDLEQKIQISNSLKQKKKQQAVVSKTIKKTIERPIQRPVQKTIERELQRPRKSHIRIEQQIIIRHHQPYRPCGLNQGNNVRQRSRSGSLIRYQYDVQHSQRILLNGQVIPCRISVKRSQSPLREPQYVKLEKSIEKQHERIKYVGKSRQEMNKMQNRNLEYQTPLTNRHLKPRSPSPARIIYVERSPVKHQYQQNSNIYHEGQKKGAPRIKRLNSKSKIAFNYVNHLQS